MKSIIAGLLTLLLTTAFALAAPESAPGAETPEESATAPNDDSAEDAVPEAKPDDSMRARPGGLRETVTETLRNFTPSEEIDVDRPVDFPTNI